IDRKPAQGADVVGWTRISGDDAREIVHVEGVVQLCAVGVPINENRKRPFELDVESGFFANLPANAVDRVFAGLQESAGHVPVATKRVDGPLGKQDPVAVDDKGAGARLRPVIMSGSATKALLRGQRVRRVDRELTATTRTITKCRHADDL